MDWETGKHLIDHFLEDTENRIEGLEPYPVSLRTINWIKFLALNDRYPKYIVDALYAQYRVLSQNLEYHLLGNHLLENGFSLLFGAVFFQDETLRKLARKIVQSELNEQILDDGAHFELSPMYHVILLQRALDGYNLLIDNQHELQEIQVQLESCIQKMVNWLNVIMFRNGDIPMLNDSTYGQALQPQIVLDYAKQLGFTPDKPILSDSGYRKLESGDFELFADVGEIGPSYQPGHAHSDTLSFVLYHKGNPVIVDRGVSTYEKNQTREEERSTASHNTVMLNNSEQSDVWGGFRVGRRASCKILTDHDNTVKACHTGYSHLGVTHTRTWNVASEEIQIADDLSGGKKKAVASLHLYPDVSPVVEDPTTISTNDLTITFKGHTNLSIHEYDLAVGFNMTKRSKKIMIDFDRELHTSVRIKK